MPRKQIVEGYAHTIERTKLYDVPAIELAKLIIEKDLISHMHISMLANKAGINEFKLKIGSRELFQTSPYKYPLNLCLQKAKVLLRETDDTIINAAKVRFNTQNAFGITFKKVYQIAPTERVEIL